MSAIKEILLENIRSFYGEYIIPIKPITLFVGENNTGKTSILAALGVLAQGNPVPIAPNFNESPFNLGLFEDIVTMRGGQAGREVYLRLGSSGFLNERGFATKCEYIKGETKPRLREFEFITDNFYLKANVTQKNKIKAAIAYKRDFTPIYDEISIKNIKKPKKRKNLKWREAEIDLSGEIFESLGLDLIILNLFFDKTSGKKEKTEVITIESGFFKLSGFGFRTQPGQRVFNVYHIAPIRAKPERVYEAYKEFISAEGNHIPFVLEVASRKDGTELFEAINEFGIQSGLYSAIIVRQLGRRKGALFELGVKVNGPNRNIVDVGYGVSQILPIIVESLRAPKGAIITLQEPEIHLHPKAQAALGSLIAILAGTQNKTFVIETHSDYILNRIRTEIKKGKIRNFKSDDVAIYFTELEKNLTKLYTIELDEKGRIIKQPPSYRQFFMEETYELLKE